MEAGRSVFNENTIYFAAYQSYQLCCYTVHDKKWWELEKQMLYSNPGLAVIDGKVVTIGGRHDGNHTNELWAWNGSDWIKCHKNMNTKRSDPAILVYKNFVIACGGNLHTFFPLHWTGDVEVYNVEQDWWKVVCKLPLGFCTRIEVTLCCSNDDDVMYVFTGHYKKGLKCSCKELTSSSFDGDPWKPIKGPPLAFTTPATLSNNVVCVGGADANGHGKTDVYMYQERDDSWRSIGNMQGKGRMYCMVEVCENRCIILGGVSEMTDNRNPSKRVNIIDFYPEDERDTSE